MIKVQNTGLYNTLLAQLDKLARHNRHGSFKTRERYYNSMKRFCAFLADSFRLEKLANVSEKHLTAYVADLQGRSCSAAYIKTELSAIRLFHDLIPEPRHSLPPNSALSLERRRFGGVDRTWREDEFSAMLQCAADAGRDDFVDMLTLIRCTGLRLHECARLDTASAAAAIRTGTLTIKGKGGKARDIPADHTATEVLQRRLHFTRRGAKLFVPDGVQTDALMKQLELFVLRHREDPDGNRDAALTVHGLRHTWAAERYQELVSAGKAPLDARRQVSQWLGHERDSVTKIYLASLRPGEGGERP